MFNRCATYVMALQKPCSRESLVHEVLSICHSVYQSRIVHQRHGLAGRELHLNRIGRIGRGNGDRRLYIFAADDPLGTISITCKGVKS